MDSAKADGKHLTQVPVSNDSRNGKTIVSKHRVIARDIRRTKAIKLRIQEQTEQQIRL
jgi:hypothetical protein